MTQLTLKRTPPVRSEFDCMEPLQFTPILKCRRWGGRKLGDRLGKALDDRQDYAESWEICDMGDSQSVVQSGPLAGKTLNEIVHEFPEELLGGYSGNKQFPLLLKYLDSNQASSLQVHPNNDQALRIAGERNGKTEAWVILEASEESWIYAGLKAGIGRKEFLQAISEGNITECLHRLKPQKGEVYYIPAGTIHSLGAGILVAEIQQSSDLTYRIHDWGWVDENGHSRELHLEEALECLDFERGPIEPICSNSTPFEGNCQTEPLIESPYFEVERISCEGSTKVLPENRCRILMVLDGTCDIISESSTHACQTGSTLLLPASCPEVLIKPDSGANCQILLTRVV